MKRPLALFAAFVLALSAFVRAADLTPLVGGITLVLPAQADGREPLYAELAARHLRDRAPGLTVDIVRSDEFLPASGGDRLAVYVGRPETAPLLARWLERTGRAPVSADNPGPEGFHALIEANPDGPGHRALIAAVEPRSVLFGLGWLLRQTRVDAGGLRLLLAEERSAPAVRLRGANGHERQAMDPSSARATKARAYPREEGLRYFEEQWLLGANQWYHGWGSSVPVDVARYDAATGRGVGADRSALADRYDIDYVVHHSINGIDRRNMKPEWRALDQGGLHNANVCVSVPEAREFLLKIKADFFKWAPRVDRVIFAPSDVAGCECERCAHWPHTYYQLAEEMAADIHKHHPRAAVVLANQDFQIADNEWFFGKIRDERPSWFGGYCMAPGGSETNTYGGVVPNPRWNRWPGLFPRQAFVRSLLRHLEPRHETIALTDISHWKRAEYGIAYIDPLFSEVYHRRTFNARPRAYHDILRSNIAYFDGLIGYSEGNYDDFNRFLLLRLTWNPDLTAAQIAREYYAYHCGEAAADLLAEAAFQGELNYELPVLKNGDGIRRMHDLTLAAKELIPPALLEKDWRFAMLAQRAATDRYIFLRQSRLKETFDAETAALEPALNADGEGTPFADRIHESITRLTLALDETGDELRLREEALAWDDLTDRNGGIRSSALLAIREHDGAGVRWLRSRLREAADAPDPRALVRDAVLHDRVGPGEFYEDCGTLSGQPHFDFSSGELYYGTGGWPDDARPSQRTYNYSHSHQDGLRFVFSGLHPETDYELTFVHPNPSGVSFAMNSPNEFDVYVNGELLTRFVPSGKGFDHAAVAIPARLLGEGRLELQLRRAEGRARSTCISELWLRKAAPPDAK